jgi:hypothetical protein
MEGFRKRERKRKRRRKINNASVVKFSRTSPPQFLSRYFNLHKCSLSPLTSTIFP